MQITPIPAFTDNYIWALHNELDCVVVDPGDPIVVLEFLATNKLTLRAILITHHHYDHTGGIEALQQHYPDIPVFGPNNPTIKGITQVLQENDVIELPDLQCEFSVIEVPGHTLDHIMYYAKGVLFCGDTLFSCGCGRMFEGTAPQMTNSLAKIQHLPQDTQIYCTHEYTAANIAFAETVEPDNKDLTRYKQWVEQQRNKNAPTLPTSLSEQLQINPFLRLQAHSVKQFTQQYARKSGQDTSSDSVQVFATLRKAKDDF